MARYGCKYEHYRYASLDVFFLVWQAWYAKAVKLAPSIPSAYYSWGMALAKHGDLSGAAAQFKDANLKGPHWADPLKAWGDVLVKQGHATEALAKYDAALKYVPNWKQLKEVRETVVTVRCGLAEAAVVCRKVSGSI